MGKGFLGTPASLMLDVVVCSLIIVLPVLLASLYLVRIKRDYLGHKRIQIALCAVLLVVVLLFEIDLRLQGGFWAMAKDSPYVETAFLRWLLRIHLAFSTTTVALWALTLGTALRYFPNPPVPGSFGPKHKTLAWIAVLDMTATIVTGLMVYYYGFYVTAPV